MSATVSNALSGLVTVRQLAEHTGYSRSTVYKWSSGERPSPYPEPVRKNGRVIGWRREDVEAADKANKYSRADWLYGRKAACDPRRRYGRPKPRTGAGTAASGPRAEIARCHVRAAKAGTWCDSPAVHHRQRRTACPERGGKEKQ